VVIILEPIISPWLIYIVDVASTIKIVSMIVMILGIVAVILFPMLADTADVQKETLIRIEKLIGAITVVSILLVIFIPTKTTLLMMLVLQYTTPDNVSLVQDNIIDFVQKIAEAVKVSK